MPSSSPGRLPSEKDLIISMNGGPMFPLFPGLTFGATIPGTFNTLQYSLSQAPASGILTSTGAAVNNITTATPFATGVFETDGTTRSLKNSMAGRTYLVNAVAAGTLMVSDSPLVGSPAYWTVALNTTVPPAAGTFPGIPLAAASVSLLFMPPTCGWLQWISTTGTASLVCLEVF